MFVTKYAMMNMWTSIQFTNIYIGTETNAGYLIYCMRII
jgi:hypothetical protein